VRVNEQGVNEQGVRGSSPAERSGGAAAASLVSTVAAVVVLAGLVAAPAWMLGFTDSPDTAGLPALELGSHASRGVEAARPPAASAPGSATGAGPRAAPAGGIASTAGTNGTHVQDAADAPASPEARPLAAEPIPAQPVQQLPAEAMAEVLAPPAAAETPAGPGALVAPEPPDGNPSTGEDGGDAVQDRRGLDPDPVNGLPPGIPDAERWLTDPGELSRLILPWSGIPPQ
jgi:hypothetical protein